MLNSNGTLVLHFVVLSHFGTTTGTETPRESKESSGLYEL